MSGKPKKSDIETAFAVRSLDADITLEEYGTLTKNSLYIILDNLRSAFNVGSIFRLCDTMRVSGLYLCGYTATPPHEKLAKTSLGTVAYVPWKHFSSTVEAVEELKREGVTVWAAETTSHSRDYNTADYPEKLGIVFGNEALGVSSDVLPLCDSLVEIPLYGFKNSLNVATACAVLGFKAIAIMGRTKKTTVPKIQ